MNSDQNRLLMVVVLSGAILFGWQYFFSPEPSGITHSSTPTAIEQQLGSNTSADKVDNSAPTEIQTQAKELTLSDTISGQEFSWTNAFELINAKGKTSSSTYNDVMGNEKPFKIQVLDQNNVRDIHFENFVVENGKISGTSNQGISFSANILENGKLSYSITSTSAQRYRFLITSKEDKPSNQQPRDFLIFGKSADRYSIGKDKTEESVIKWFGIDFSLHLFAFTFEKETPVTYQMAENGILTVTMNKAETELKGNIVFTKKNYDDLVALGENLKQSVDFGILGLIAVPILRGLQFFYKFFPNYGVSIIFLTILLRIVTFPLQYKSFKSMKKMQGLQPELTKLKDKYKDDNQKLQQESMALFKRTGVNPLSGCLPILLQLPIFIAFYKVLFNAVELVGAPFIFWIHDLSIKDPFYVLPIIMTGAMFLQQKMTPTTTMDPTQQKIMLFMPLIFGVFMMNLPSGLALYICVSTILGIFQQLLVYKMVKD